MYKLLIFFLFIAAAMAQHRICMEALCAQRDTTVENTVSALRSLVTLLDAPENRARLMKDRALAIEACDMVQRIGLTQESVEPLLLAADLLHLIIIAAAENLQARMQAKIKGYNNGRR